MFHSLITTSYIGVPIRGELFVPRIGMIIANQPEEQTLLCLKRRNSFMDCSLCTLPSIVKSQTTPRSISTVHLPSSAATTPDEDDLSMTRSRRTCPNTSAHLYPASHSQRDVTETLSHQLRLATQNRTTSTDIASIAVSRRFLIACNAHDIPLELAFLPDWDLSPIIYTRS